MDEVTLHVDCGPAQTKNLGDPVGRIDTNGMVEVASMVEGGDTALVWFEYGRTFLSVGIMQTHFR